MHQTLHIRISSRVVHYNGALVSIRAGDRVDRRNIGVGRLCVLEFNHRVAVAEEPGWRQAAGVEDDGGDVGGDLGVGVGGCVVHVCGDGGGAGSGHGVVDVVEKDAGYGDVGFGVAGPGCVCVDVGDYPGVGALGELCVDVAERLHIGVAVQFRDGGDVVLVRRVAVGVGGAGAAVWVHDYLPMYFWVGGDGGGGSAPGRGGGAGVDVEGEENE